MLARALASLRAQTFTRWVCELHNDDPADNHPRQLLEQLGDPRISLHQHDRNWGAVASFNAAFQGGPEPYASLLEDDNWWEPDFLAEALAAFSHHSEASLVWANMRVWREEADDSWTDLHRTIWSVPDGATEPWVFRWPTAIQATNALHSNGAMIFRPAAFATRTVPPRTPFAVIEFVRERAARGPLVFLPKALANFAITRETARNENRVLWMQSRLLLAASYFQAVRLDRKVLAGLWSLLRGQRPPDTNLFFAIAWSLRRVRLMHPARGVDLVRFGLSLARHPLIFWRGLRFRDDQPELWTWLERHTLPADLGDDDADRLLEKVLPANSRSSGGSPS